MINRLGGLYRELHYVNVPDSDTGYEPSLVILDRKKKGRSFIIPISAMWKYVDPIDYKEDIVATKADWQDFNEIMIKANQILRGGSKSEFIQVKPSLEDKKEAMMNVAACQFSYAFHKSTSVYLCTGYNLAKCMQMFGISPTVQAAAQLLLWIQSRLDDLKNMPENSEKEEQYVGGEADIFVDGKKVATKEMRVSETELVVHENA